MKFRITAPAIYYTTNSTNIERTKVKEYISSVQSLIDYFNSGNDIYVEFPADHKRAGAIGKIKSIDTKYYDIMMDKINKKYNAWTGYHEALKFDVCFDDRKNTLKLNLEEAIILSDYTGPTIWVPAPPPSGKSYRKPKLDKFGRELETGDFVIFSYPQSKSKAMTAFGIIESISKSNTCYVKTMIFHKDEKQAEFQIKDNSSLIKVTSDLMEQITMARLSV